MTMNRRQMLLTSAGAAGAVMLGGGSAFAQTNLRYGHMHTPASVAGQSADLFAKAVAAKTGGKVKVTVYPSSQLGKLQELAEGNSMGTIAITHNTAAGVGSLYAPIAALDTPYLYRDVDHLMKVVDTQSGVMKTLNEGLIKNANVRVLYAFYFGKRHLTANKEVKTRADLSGVKIRSIPFPIYMAAVEGLGAVPVPVDWSEVPTALATGVVAGQENPVNVISSAKLYEVQKYMMLTGHIIGAELVTINEEAWQGLGPDMQKAVMEAAEEVRVASSKLMLDSEAADLAAIKAAGMTVIGPEDGLKVEEFAQASKTIVKDRFSSQYGSIYDMIAKFA
jgi:TRAP-type transport system periplasmic protein